MMMEKETPPLGRAEPSDSVAPDSSPIKQIRRGWVIDALVVSVAIALVDSVLQLIESLLGMERQGAGGQLWHTLCVAGVIAPILAWRFWARTYTLQPVQQVTTSSSPHGRVRGVMWVALCAIGILFTIEFVAGQQMQKQASSDAELINIAGRQRMLSQRVARHASVTLHSEDQHAREALMMTLTEDVERLMTEAQDIESGLAAFGGRLLTNIDDTLETFHIASDAREDLKGHLDTFIDAIRASDVDAATAAEHGIQSAADEFLPKMEAGVAALQAFSERSLEDRLQGERFLLALLIGMLLLVAFLVVEPVVQLIRREHAAAEARSAEFERLAAVAEHTVHAVVMLNRDGTINWVNKGFTRLTGRGEAEVIGQDGRAFLIGDDDGSSASAHLEQALTENRTFIGTVRTRDQRGFVRWYHIDLHPRTWGNGDSAGFIAVCSDVTDLMQSRQRAESALREVNTWRSAVDQHSLLSVTDKRGRIIEVNTGFCEISGYEREELIGQDHRLLNSGEQPKSFWVDVWKTISSGHAWRGEICNRRKDGTLYWVDSTIMPTFDHDGNIIRYVSLRFDVTSKKHAEFALRREQEAAEEARREVEAQRAELQTIIDAIPSAILYKDVEDTIINLNGAAAGMLGTSVEDARGRNAGEFRRRVRSSIDHDDEQELLRTGRALVGPIEEVEDEDGSTRFIRTDRIPLKGPTGRFERLVTIATDITEVTEAKEALAQTQARFERAVDGSSDGLWDYEPATGTAWYSIRFKELLGFGEADNDEFPGVVESWSRRLHPADRDATMDALERHMRGEAPYDVMYRLERRDGTWRWFRARGQAIRDEHGNVLRVSGSLTDINDRRTAEERLSLAMKASSIGLWDWNLKDDSTYFSDTFFTMLGYEPGELPMNLETWTQLCHPDDLDDAMADIKRHIAGESRIYSNEHRLQRKDGTWMWIRDVGEMVEFDEDGAPARMLGVHIDIDDQVRARQELGALEEQLRMFVEHTPAAVAMFDTRMRYLVVSRGWYQQYELPDEDIVGRSHYDVFPETPTQWRSLHLRSLRGDVLSAERDAFRRQDGSMTWVRWQLRPWYQADGSIGGVIMFTEVINDQIEHEQRLDEARQAAEAANIAKTEFLANMSHEIRTPMTAILGYTDLLAEDGTATTHDDNRLDYIDTIRRNGEHLLTVINDVLDISKIEAGRMTVERIPTEPVTIAQDVVQLMEVKTDAKGLNLNLEIEGDVPATIESDPVRLRQILVNLVGNAVKFTEHGDVTVRLSFESEGSRMCFDVIDSGIGVEPHQMKRLFEAFNQADSSMARRFGGTGLGLPISRSFAELLGGSLSATSELGQGSCFSLAVATGVLNDVEWISQQTLAESTSHAHTGDGARETETSEVNEKPLDGCHILLAEDGPDNQRLIRFHLVKAGAEVTIAENGAEALRLMTADGTVEGALHTPFPFDLVLTDMQMPELDGYTLARELRKRDYTGPIIALTAHAMSSDRDRCIAAGCDEYTTKPIDRHALIHVLTASLETHSRRDAA